MKISIDEDVIVLKERLHNEYHYKKQAVLALENPRLSPVDKQTFTESKRLAEERIPQLRTLIGYIETDLTPCQR